MNVPVIDHIRNNSLYRVNNDRTLQDIATKKVRSQSPHTTVENTSNSFDAVLAEGLKKAGDIQFSKHSKTRIEERGIPLTDELVADLSAAVGKARLKGAKDVVMIGRDAAFIVNVPNNVVVTAINGDEMKENIFTNIDGAVLL